MQGGTQLVDLEDGVWVRPKDQRIILDTRDAILEVRNTLAQIGETSAVDFNNADEFDFFMQDLCAQCDYYPIGYGDENLRRMIDKCLDNCEEVLSGKFSSTQRQLWFNVAKTMIDQSFEFGLRDITLVNQYTYARMLGDSVILRPYY